MDSASVLSHLCAVEFHTGDSAYLVAWSNGEFGIVRNGEPVGQHRWKRQDLSDAAKAFLSYIRIMRTQASGETTQAIAS